jgi:drug/metabolite transporter (DMT)-like permease
MPWYSYLAAFFAGAFLANAVPHFVKGVTGEPFPSPFAKPPGKGLSSPIVNVLWGFLNSIIGLVLFHIGHMRHHPQHIALILFFTGILIMSLMLAATFGATSAANRC